MPTINSTSTGDIESDILYERKQSILQNVLEGVYNTLTSDKIDLNIAIIVFLISFAYLIHYEFKKLENKKLAIAFGNKSAAQIVAKNNSDEEQSMRLLNNAFTGGVQAASISGLAITGNLGLAGYMASNAAAQLLNAPAPQDTHDEYIKALTQGEQPSESKKHKGGKRSRRRYSVKNKYVGRRSRRRSVHKKQ
jgi:hypothetical protein